VENWFYIVATIGRSKFKILSTFKNNQEKQKIKRKFVKIFIWIFVYKSKSSNAVPYVLPPPSTANLKDTLRSSTIVPGTFFYVIIIKYVFKKNII